MGTTKDPEGFRRHTAGRGDVLGVKGGGAKRRGCGLGLGAVLAAGLLGALAWSLRGVREPRSVAATEPIVEAQLALAPPTEPFEPRLERDAALTELRSAVLATGSDEFVTPPEPASRGLATLRLLRGWSDAPLAGTEVRWLGREELRRMRENGLRVSTVSLEPVLTEHGRSASTDADGLLRVGADGAHLLVQGDGWTRELEVLPDLEGLLDVRVFHPRTLSIDVIDWRGLPVPEHPVHLMRVDVGGKPQHALRYLWTPPTSGSIRFADVDGELQPSLEPRKQDDSMFLWCAMSTGEPAHREPPPVLERTRLRVGLDPHLAPDQWVEFDLAQDPLPNVRLHLPRLGVVRVLVASEDGRPVDWRGRVELCVEPGGDADRTQDLVDGRAEFHNLQLDLNYTVRAVREDGSTGREVLTGRLEAEEAEREVVLADVAPMPRVRLLPIHPDGRALANEWISVRIAADDVPIDVATRLAESWTNTVWQWSGSLRTDAWGFLDMPLPMRILGRERAVLVVCLVSLESELASSPRRLERGAAWGDLDLGPVPLNAPDPEPAGSR